MKFINYIQAGLIATLAIAAVSCSNDDDAASPVPVSVGTTADTLDLGLPSGTIWADHNLGATSPADYGNYYGFGEVTGTVQTMENADYHSWTAPSEKDLFEANKKTHDAVAKLDTTQVATYPLESTLTKYFTDNLDKLTNLTASRTTYINNYTDSVSIGEKTVEAAKAQKEASREKLANKTQADSLAFAADSLALDSLSGLLSGYQASLKYYKETWLLEQIPNMTNTLKTQPKDYVYQDASNIIVAYNDTTFTWKGNNADIKACDICGTEYDPATKAWGSDWQLPSSEQIKELLTKCTWTSADTLGVKGYKVTGPNGRSIFLPFSGYRLGYDVVGKGNDAYYWSGNVNGSYTFPGAVEQLSGDNGSVSSDSNPSVLFISGKTLSVEADKKLTTQLYYGVCQGLAVRPVKAKK